MRSHEGMWRTVCTRAEGRTSLPYSFARLLIRLLVLLGVPFCDFWVLLTRDGGVCFRVNMNIAWNRRQFLQGAGSAFAVGAAMAGAPVSMRAQASAVSDDDDAVRCVTTTKDAPWQTQELAKPGWRWDALNLNVDLSATAQTMEGFGGCFNERGWTSLSKLSDAGPRECFAGVVRSGCGCAILALQDADWCE